MEAAAATLGFTTGGDARVHFFLWREHWRSIEDEDEGRENLEIRKSGRGNVRSSWKRVRKEALDPAVLGGRERSRPTRRFFHYGRGRPGPFRPLSHQAMGSGFRIFVVNFVVNFVDRNWSRDDFLFAYRRGRRGPFRFCSQGAGCATG
jgi:hypothetical protein